MLLLLAFFTMEAKLLDVVKILHSILRFYVL